MAEAFPESGLQIGLWLNGEQGCRDIVSGVLDDKIYLLFDFIRSDLPESLPKVFLRVGYEFDNPSFGYSDNPAVYQEAFRKLVRACETQMTAKICHEKIAFVWHSWAAPRKIDTTLDQFYPGDYFVDWVGVSVFQQLYPWANDESKNKNEGHFAGGNILDVKEVLEFAKTRKKPIMIAESTPFGGMDVIGSNVAEEYIDVNNNNIWDLWFQKTVDIINEYDIAMWSYINCDWGSQPMWKGIGFGDTRLSSSDVVMSHWWDQVLNNNSRFLLRIESCDEQSSPSGIEVKNEGSFVPQQEIAGALTAMVVGLEDNDRRTNSFTLTQQLSCLLCVCTFTVLLLLRMRLVHSSTKQRHRIKTTSSQTYDVLNSNSRSVYGSLE